MSAPALSLPDLIYSLAGHTLPGLAGGWYLRTLYDAWREYLPGGAIPVRQKGTAPMAGYLNRFIHLGFSELGGIDEAAKQRGVEAGLDEKEATNRAAYVWVKIRNPRLIPGEELMGGADVSIGPDGKPVDSGKAMKATYEQISRLVIAGCVPDPTYMGDDEDNWPPLPMPPSPDVVARYPIEILNAIGEELKNSVPR